MPSGDGMKVVGLLVAVLTGQPHQRRPKNNKRSPLPNFERSSQPERVPAPTASGLNSLQIIRSNGCVSTSGTAQPATA